MSSEIERPRNLPFIGRKYSELKKAGNLNEEEVKELERINKKIAKEDVERGKKAIQEMRDELEQKE